MEESPNSEAAARPSAAGRQPGARIALPGLSDSSITPAIATPIAPAIGQVTMSPRKRKPNSATSTGSVLR